MTQPLSARERLITSLRRAIQLATPAERAEGLSREPLPYPGETEPFDLSQTEFARSLNKFLENTSDSVQGLMDYVSLSGDWIPASSPFHLEEPIRPGDTDIHILLRAPEMDQEWVLEEERNRLGMVEDASRISLSTILLEYSQRDARRGRTVRLILNQPVTRRFIRDYYEQSVGEIPPNDEELLIPAGASVARFERIRNDNFTNRTIDVMLNYVDAGIDVLDSAVDTILGKDHIEIACCLLRQLAAISNAGANAATWASDRLTPSERAQEELQRIREFVIRARIIATFSMDVEGFSFKFMMVNIYKTLIDAMLISLSATLQIVYRNARESIYALAFGLLQRNRIVNCMPFYDLVRGLMAWLFSRKGILGWLAGFTFQSVSRMRAFFSEDLPDFNRTLKKRINFEKLIYLLDSIIAATANLELCQDLLSQYRSDGDDITKGGTGLGAGTGEEDQSATTLPDEFSLPRGLDDSRAVRNRDNPDYPSGGLGHYDDLEGTLDDVFGPIGTENVSLSDLETTGAEALGLILQPSDKEIEQFMINRLGADPTIARDAVYRSKLGECAKGLDPSELSNVIAALQDAGLEV